MPSVLILYNTKTGNTELMAKAVEEGAKTIQGVKVILTYHANPKDLQNADAIIVGTPTYNHQITLDIQNLLEKAAQNNVTLKDKIAAAFGSYGWSGEAPKRVLEVLQNKFQMKTIEPPVLAKYRPDEETLKKCETMGKKVAKTLL